METQEQSLQKIGRFQLIRQIGHGAQGSVWLATDPQLGRTVAVKTVTIRDGTSKAAVDQLLREARMASAVSHPNLVPVYEVGVEGGTPYIVFEYVEGRTLVDILRSDGAMPLARAVITMSQVLGGIAHAHAKGLVHGDITPANILVTPQGVPRVTDFGISRRASERDSGAPAGTLRYMAPEQFREGGSADPRTDVYALGAIFYEMLTGQPAVSGGEEFSMIYRVLNQPIPSPSQIKPDVDPKLDEIVRHAVEKEPAARYADAGAMKAALDRFRIAAPSEGVTELRSAAAHSTVEFLLLRMRRNADFPALSERLSNINQLTLDSSSASIQKLTQLVVQDFALTNKLLKVVNSTAYHGDARVTNVSEAIMKLGVDQVRAIATGLMLSTPPRGRALHPVFPEVLLGAFIAAIIGRNLGRLANLGNSEEVFICSLLSRLGEVLAIYYFPEEYDEIANSVHTSGMDELSASRTVLGVGFDVLGIEVARRWNFPPNVVHAMQVLPEGVLPEAATEQQRIAHCAGMARELCDAAWRVPDAQHEEALQTLIARFSATLPGASRHLRTLIAHSLALGQKYCEVIGVETTASPLIEGLGKWCPPPAAPDGEPAAPRQGVAQPETPVKPSFAAWLRSLWRGRDA